MQRWLCAVACAVLIANGSLAGASDEVKNDLRSMVWKGHYLGYGTAEALATGMAELRESGELAKIFLKHGVGWAPPMRQPRCQTA